VKVIKDIPVGPYAPGQETRFKADVMKHLRKGTDCTCFAIETEETVPGFPDCIACYSDVNSPYELIEFKVSTKGGHMNFKWSQTIFYSRYPKLPIRILVWDVPKKRLVCLLPAEILSQKTTYPVIPED
jgi:hypothetical protein